MPNTRVLHLINPYVSAILRSPVHSLLSKQVLLLTYTGRKSGNPHTIPVGYIRDGDTYSSAGVDAGMDLALALVEEDHGADAARRIAQGLLVYMQRAGGQSQFSAQ